jgi:hypothetical protein
MKTVNSSILVAVLLALAGEAYGFSTSSSFSGSQISTPSSSVQNNNGLSMEYIPDGISKEQWKKMKEAERNKSKGKNLGQTGEYE